MTVFSFVHPLNANFPVRELTWTVIDSKGFDEKALSSNASTVVPEQNVIVFSGNESNEWLHILSMCMFCGIVTSVIEGADPNTCLLIVVNESGVVNLSKLEQPRNAPSPMLISLQPLTNVIELSFAQELNVSDPIEMTFFGTVKDAMFVHPANAESPIADREESLEKLIVDKLVQSANDESPMLLHVREMLIAVRLVHCLKLELPMTLQFASSTLTRFAQFMNELSPMMIGLAISNTSIGWFMNAESWTWSTVTPSSNMIDFSLIPLNAPVAMKDMWTFEGMRTVCMLGADPKMSDVISVKESGVVKFVNDVHPENAFMPIDMRLLCLENVTLAIPTQS